MLTMPDGGTMPAPAGVTAAQAKLAQSAMNKRLRGETPTDEEQAAGRAVFSAIRAVGGMGGAGGGGFRRSQGEPSTYIVFALRNGQPTPVQIRTGLSDLDHIEVVSGLTAQRPAEGPAGPH